MGLDMTLYRKTWVGEFFGDDSVKVKVEHKTNRKGQLACIIEEVKYWRKANAIHGWFVEHCADGLDECQIIRVDRDDLEALLSALETVQNDHSRAPELLPTRQGFFFGTYNYDDYYWQYVESTIAFLKEELESTKDALGAVEWEYVASW